jgi:hypothetical protein
VYPCSSFIFILFGFFSGRLCRESEPLLTGLFSLIIFILFFFRETVSRVTEPLCSRFARMSSRPSKNVFMADEEAYGSAAR